MPRPYCISVDGIKRSLGITFAIAAISAPFCVGYAYRDDCPSEPMIPIWWIVFGCLFSISAILEVAISCECIPEGNNTRRFRLLHTSLLIWIIFGSAIVYMNYQNYELKNEDWDKLPFKCDRLFYGATFKFLISFTVIAVIVPICYIIIKKYRLDQPFFKL